MASITKRVRRDGGVFWAVRVRINGYATLSQTFPTKQEAPRWAALTQILSTFSFISMNECTFALTELDV